MALINRFEVINFLDKIGDADKWQPNFRFIHLDMQGLSSLVRMDNGQGKTSMASALYLLLTRHRKLAAEVNQKMSPAGKSSWSHIRVEVVVNDEAQPLFVNAGQGVTGETWVFGVCGHREEGLKFYFYQGRLEDLPAAHDYGDRIKVFSNKEFYDNQKVLGRVRWEPTMDDYNAALASIFPPRAFQLGLDLHLRGGAENADIFPVKGKEPASELFYEHIAPHLLASDIPPEEAGEDGEYFFEETIINSAQHYGRATIQTEKSRAKVEKFDRTIQASNRLRTATADVKQKEAAAKEIRKGTEVGLVILSQIVKEQAIPGIPNDNVPEGLIGDIVRGMVWHSTERELCLQDSALVKLTGQEIRILNQEALRHSIKCFPKEKDRLVLSPKEMLKLETRQYGKVYPLDSVDRILERNGVGIPGKLSLEETRNIVRDAAQWWREHCDTNTARNEAKRLQEVIVRLEGHTKELSGEVKGLAQRETEIVGQLEDVDLGKSAWQSLVNSRLFSEEELAMPEALGARVEETTTKAREALDQHLRKHDRLKPLQPAYQECTQLYPGTSPEHAFHSQSQHKEKLQKREDECRTEQSRARQNENECNLAVQKSQRTLDTLIDQERKFTQCQKGNQEFLETFAGEDPNGLETRVQKDLRDTEAKIATIKEQRNQLLPQVASINEFRGKHPGQDCDLLISGLKTQLEEIYLKEGNLKQEESDAKARLEDLRQHKIAPTQIARRALDLVSPPKTLHEAIVGFNLSSDQKARVLSSLSSVLFSPVFMSLEDAGKAVSLLEEKKLPIPVFIEEELKRFAENQTITKVEDICFSHQVGRQTLTVSTILDPEKIHQLIEETRQELTRLEGELKSLKEEKTPLEKDQSWLNDVKRAIDSNAEEKLLTADKNRKALEDGLPRLNRRASQTALEAIRARREFLNLGGDAGQEQVSEKLRVGRDRLETAKTEHQLAKETLKVADQNEKTARSARQNFEKEWSKLEAMFKNAIQFLKDGGPDFMRSAEQIETTLRKEHDEAEKRRPFDFKAAQQFIDAREGVNKLVQELEQIKDRKKDKEKKLAELNEEKELKEKANTRAFERMYRIDEGVAGLLSLWRDFYSAIPKGVTIQSLENLRKLVAEKSPRLQPFFAAIDQIAINMNKDSGAEKIRQAFVMINDSLDAIGKKIEEVKRKQKEADNAQRNFKEECERYMEIADGLAINERDVIATAGDNYDDVLDLFRNLDAICQKEKSKLEELERALEAITTRAHERLASLLDSAEDNLRLLRKVAKRTAEGTIIVECSTIDSDALKQLIRDLLIEVQEELRYREERAKSAFPETDRRAESEWKKSLRNKIAECFYRGVFPTAKVLIKHPSVRGGKPISFRKEGISSGERLAIALVVIGKLQEFIQDREAYWQTRDSVRRRKRGKTQGLLLLDGIFSKLSQKEMIQIAMDAYRGLKGSFQLIGLNHYEIENDEVVFPNYFEVRKVTSTTGGFLALDRDYKPVTPEEVGRREGELAVARTTILPTSSVSEVEATFPIEELSS